MKRLLRTGLSFLFLLQMSFICFAQSDIISTVAGSPLNGVDSGCTLFNGLFQPTAVAVDSSGNLYIADVFNNCILKVTPGGTFRNVAGNGASGYGGDGGSAASAKISNPNGVAVDSAGNLYIADSGNNRIRKVTPDGIINTVAGNGIAGHSGDGGPAASAALYHPSGVAVDSSGNLYIVDSGNICIRKVTPGGIISTVAGNGTEGYSGDGGSAISAALSYPSGVAVDSSGNLYIAELANACIRKVTADGIISTVAGNGTAGYGGDGGPATSASLFGPSSVAVDSSGNLYIADYTFENNIRKVTPGGIISTVAGNGWYSGDGGSADSAEISSPSGVAVDSSGNLYIADTLNNRVRKVTRGGIISTVAGNGIGDYGGDGGSATDAMLSFPYGVAVDSSGNLYISEICSNRIRKVTADGIISTIAGDGGPATSAEIQCPSGVAVDSSGNLYIADIFNSRIRKITPGGIIITVAGDGTEGYSGDGGSAASAKISGPFGVAVDASGNLYIADTGNNRIRKVTPDGIINTIAGNGTAGYSGDGGSATAAEISSPSAVTVDASGNLYIADFDSNRIRKVTPDGIINTVAGNGIKGYSGDGGSASAAEISGPSGVAVDLSGNLYIADTGNNRIRKVVKPNASSYLDLSAGGAGRASAIAGNPDTPMTGYAVVDVQSGAIPYGTAVFSFKEGGVTVSEAGVPASPPTTAARVFIDYRSSVSAVPARSDAGVVDINTGIAVVNYGIATANVTYTLRNASGSTLSIGHGTMAAGAHFNCFINQLKDVAASDFDLPANFKTDVQFGALDIGSDQPLSVLALRGTYNQRRQFIITTTPVADLAQLPQNSPVYFPQFADGGGYTTSLILMNTSTADETGTFQIMDNNGAALAVNQAGGSSGSFFSYSIPGNGIFHFQTDGSPANWKTGWVQLTPDAGTSTPVGSGVYGYNPENVLVSESGVPSSSATTHARIYVDRSGNHNMGLAIANISNEPANITINAFQSDGITTAGTSNGPLSLAAHGHSAQFADQLITGLPDAFMGILDISSTTPFGALTVRSLYNENNDYLMTTCPAADVNQAAPFPIVFPQIAAGGGYVTQFLLLGTSGASSTQINLYANDGSPLAIGK